MKAIARLIQKGKTLKEQVYAYLKDEIILGNLKPGERLIEGKIAEELHISRSPIREAIRMLEKDGLLHVHPSGGVNVVKPSIDDFRLLYECRVEMEPLAAFYAAKRRTEEQLEQIQLNLEQMAARASQANKKMIHEINVNFHESIVKASGNPFLISLITQFRGINSFYRQSILDENPHHMNHALHEHQIIYEFILNQDSNKAHEWMKKHIENDFQIFMKQSHITAGESDE